MSELTSALGTPIEFKHNDKTYQVSLITQKIKASFEKAQFLRARDAAVMLKEALTPEEYGAHLKALNDDYIHGAYSLESENGLSFAQTSNGSITLCALCFGVSEEEMTKLMIQARAEVTKVMEVVLAESFGITKKEPEKPAETPAA